MMQRILDVTRDGLRLGAVRGSLAIYDEDKQVALDAFEDINSIMINARSVQLTLGVLQKCAAYNINVVIVDQAYRPVGIYHSLHGHHRQSAIQRAQTEVSAAFRKQIWQRIVAAKIAGQAANLTEPEYLRAMAKRVLSGDPDNLEAQAARHYFGQFFGKDFVRDREMQGINAQLNYGYAILRSAIAREIILAGMLPSFGIWHKSERNTMPLADDLIEPFRPVIDRIVKAQTSEELMPEVKRDMAGSLTSPYHYANEEMALGSIIRTTTQSLAKAIEAKDARLYRPFVLERA